MPNPRHRRVAQPGRKDFHPAPSPAEAGGGRKRRQRGRRQQAIAASLACGDLGIVDGLEPTRLIEGSASRLAQTLPRYLPDALNKLATCRPLREVFGEDFVAAMIAVKEEEHEAYQRVISSWEREHLLLNV